VIDQGDDVALGAQGGGEGAGADRLGEGAADVSAGVPKVAA
jgi:hypothetical protein